MTRFDPRSTGVSVACVVASIVMYLFVISPIIHSEGSVLEQYGSRPVSVEDAIRMTRLVDPAQTGVGSAERDPARFSPDKEHFFIVTRNGDIETNNNDYSLLLFQTDKALRLPRPEVLVSMSSSSNLPGIDDAQWLDNSRIGFLGENPGEKQQLYIIDRNTRQLMRLTDHATNVTRYAVMANGDVFFTAEQPVESFIDERVMQRGFVVSDQTLSDLISLRSSRQSAEHQALFLKGSTTHGETLVQTLGINSFSDLWPSPDSRYLVVRRMLSGAPPPTWREYHDPYMQHEIHENCFTHVLEALNQFELIDTTTLQTQLLLDAPAGLSFSLHHYSEVVWSSDSQFVVIAGTYLPIEVSDPAERQRRRANRFVVEITIPSKKVTPIVDKDLKLLRWDSSTNTLLLQGLTVDSNDVTATPVSYRKTEAGWKRLEAGALSLSRNTQPEMIVRTDPNTPPRVFVRDVRTGETSLLLDPNPQFAKLKFGRVEIISFTTGNGHRAKASLYLPVDYVPGRKYPLVIQTHGLDIHKFLIDGPYTTAFAAQPLAGNGFVVVQLEEDYSRIEASDEVAAEVSEYEGVIDYLDGRGLINVAQVGIIGFSRTGLAVERALTHSRHHFAAASLSDISDAGYFRYIALLNNHPGFARDSEVVNGDMPFGTGLGKWVRESPGFNLDKVTTPVRLEANDPMSLLFEWEWFVGLSYLHKPVDLIYMPGAAHVLQKPWDRIISQQGNVDWFCFWLKGQEDPDPAKAEQYKRWRTLRNLRTESLEKPLDAHGIGR